MLVKTSLISLGLLVRMMILILTLDTLIKILILKPSFFGGFDFLHLNSIKETRQVRGLGINIEPWRVEGSTKRLNFHGRFIWPEAFLKVLILTVLVLSIKKRINVVDFIN